MIWQVNCFKTAKQTGVKNLPEHRMGYPFRGGWDHSTGDRIMNEFLHFAVYYIKFVRSRSYPEDGVR
jgi:hypothetical protein